MIMRFGLMGAAVDHSLSPLLHHTFAEAIHRNIIYTLYSTPSFLFKTALAAFFIEGGQGLNITSPYKQIAFFSSQMQTERAMQSQAANTLWIDNGLIWADMTDGIGLVRALSRYLTLCNINVLVLGAGGVVSGLLPMLLSEARQVFVYNRTLSRAVELQTVFPAVKIFLPNESSVSYDLLLNACGLEVDLSFFSPEWLLNKPLCMDLSYTFSGESTPFMQWACAYGCEVIDGYPMLFEQGLEAFNVWHQTALTVDDFLGHRILRRYKCLR